MRHYIYIHASTLIELASLVNENAAKGYVCEDSHTSFINFEGRDFQYAEHTQRMVKDMKEEEAQPSSVIVAAAAMKHFTDRLARRLGELRGAIIGRGRTELNEIIRALKKGPTIEDLQERI